MNSKATDVASYLAELPAERKNALARLRRLCRQILKGYEECMAHGMPSYRRDGRVEVAFASQKQYISLYILKHGVLEANPQLLQGLDVGKGCVRYTNVQKMDFDAIEMLLRATVEAKGGAC